MKTLAYFLAIMLTSSIAFAQWPKEIKAKSGSIITIYQPQPESMKGNEVQGRSAFSVIEKSGNEPVFGVFWYLAKIVTNRDTRTFTLENIKVTDVKLPGIDDSTKISKLKSLLEKEIPAWGITGSLDELISTIEEEQQYSGDELKNDPPKIFYASTLTTLVIIDGEPKLQDDKNLKMKRVINSPFLIVENPDDKKYYLYGGKFWHVSSSITEGYQPVSKLPASIAALDKELKKQQTEKTTASTQTTAGAILVSTTPAELIQSAGEAQYANISGVNLLYVSNSENDIFKNMNDQKFYVLISGRWYASLKLEGPWEYISSDKLPTDFASIPEGSPKDNVLSSVAGTQASKDAIHDAQVPQTAKVDRKTATCTVTYDGEPAFEKIDGTSLELAMNTSSTVLKSGAVYYCVDKGVWFESASAKGPWKVSEKRPEDIEKIPPSSSAYNTKYVYVYDSTPEVVYVGYTPGYVGCYVYGPTVVYGTGYYYTPWYGPYYYPRPVTYGFSMHYNPWTGWSMGFHYSSGWFSFSMYGGGGYWGPPYHRPPYYPPYHGGMYGGRGPTYINGDVNINVDRSNNIYNKRNDVSTNDVKRGQGAQTKPGVSTNDRNREQNKQPQAGQQPSTAGPRKDNNVYSDKSGNVYQRNNDGNWNQRNGNEWNKTKQNDTMSRDYQNRQRSAQQNSNFNNMNRGGNMGGGARTGGGGGRRK
jgi:hypothetical protein